MYFYWRIMEELSYLGEVLLFHNPNFQREFKQWVRRNRAGLAFVSPEKTRHIFDDYDPFGTKPSLN